MAKKDPGPFLFIGVTALGVSILAVTVDYIVVAAVAALFTIGGLGGAARGVDPDRLVFAGKWPKARHLARHRLADLFLDTRYYTAHTTCSDALWTGLPVLTCPGDSFASRVAASLPLAAGLPELVVPDFAQYEERALALAREPSELGRLRARLLADRLTCPAFDTTRLVRNFERAYGLMWANHLAGPPPAPADRAGSGVALIV